MKNGYSGVALLALMCVLTAGQALAGGKIVAAHHAIDIKTSKGGPVRASASGTVVSVKPYMRGENQVTILNRDGSEMIYVYVKPSVEAGDLVVVGDVIGVSEYRPGKSNSDLHFAYRPKAGGPFDNPETVLPQRTE